MLARLVLLLLAGRAGEPEASAQTNLIRNGGFESGFSAWDGSYAIYDKSPKTVGGSAVGVVVDITHSSVAQTLRQTFPTTPGARYEIQFALRLPDLFEIAPSVWVPVVGDSRGGGTTISLQWNGATLGTFPVRNREAWNFYRLETVATEAKTQLVFFNPSALAWPFIDEVSVRAVPEPSTLALAGAGVAVLAGLGCWRTKGGG